MASMASRVIGGTGAVNERGAFFSADVDLSNILVEKGPDCTDVVDEH